ncbi:thiol:disulfide interchange protein DsbA/DsbL [Chitinimonas sp. BJYL2]|uniref:thiol:disulfide interchange protein DsbA/DsbL n=1 Tax=Chitinimonas sp. BJYL2 TaxID=2976696 RepID=UPI0022B433EB|nr:thiol:disulfide interchange protein DsbA/DsbL [Chitinimonas sp. BJYL2]
MAITRTLARLLAAGLALLALNSQAEPRAGVDFEYLPAAQATEAPGKIEVIEFFWFGCPHCYHLEPKVQAWEKTLGKDVVFRREHVLWNGRSDMEGHVRLFATLKMLGKLNALTPAAFDAIQRDRIELRDEVKLFEWVAAQGIPREQFENAYRSFGAQAGLARARQLTLDHRVDGVPTFIVNGKYKTSVTKTGNEDKLFVVVNELVAKERATLKPAKKSK